MARPTLTLSARRRWALTLTALVVGAMSIALYRRSLTLNDTAFLSGWALAGVLLFLTLYNARKKLTYPPLLKSSTWLQLHVYVGLISIALFLLHVGFRVPDGAFEITLTALFAALALSGLLGIYLTRALPRGMTVRGPEVLYERIPVYRRELGERAEELVVRCSEQTRSTTLADFYQDRLVYFFRRHRNFWRHLYQSQRPLQHLLHDLRSLDRYFNDEERRVANELTELIEAKDTLDHHYSQQGVLKRWLFVHVPLTYALLVFVVVHAVLVHAFAGAR